MVILTMCYVHSHFGNVHKVRKTQEMILINEGDVINRYTVTRQIIVDLIYGSGWTFFDDYKIPHFDPTYLMTISPDVN